MDLLWRGLVAMAASAVVLPGCLGEEEGDVEIDTTPRPVSVSPQPASEFERLETVRRGEDAGRPTPAERATTSRVIATDPALQPLFDDAGGYAINWKQTGTANGPGRGRLLGISATVRLDDRLDGVYRLPKICYGPRGDGAPFVLPPADYELQDVPELLVQVNFAAESVVDVDPFGGYSRPVASEVESPRPCVRRARQEMGR